MGCLPHKAGGVCPLAATGRSKLKSWFWMTQEKRALEGRKQESRHTSTQPLLPGQRPLYRKP